MDEKELREKIAQEIEDVDIPESRKLNDKELQWFSKGLQVAIEIVREQN